MKTEIVIEPTPGKAVVAEGSTKLAEIQKIYPELEQEVRELCITDDQSYLYADSLLGRIVVIQKGWGTIWARIQERTIKPIRAGLEGLYEMDREAKRLDVLVKAIKDRQTEFQRERLQAAQRLEAAARAEEARLQREADEKERAAQQAATPQMKGRLSAAAERMRQKAEEAANITDTIPAPPPSLHSSTRTTRKVRIMDKGIFLEGIIAGQIPYDVIPWGDVELFLNREWKLYPAEVQKFPGVQEYDDVQVVKR